MMRTIITALLCTTGLLGVSALAASKTEKPAIQTVLECMHANLPQTVIAQQLELVHSDRLQETRSFELQVYARRGDGLFETSVQIRKPASLADGAYLLKAESSGYQLYMYVPSLGQVRRLTGQNVTNSALLGTDVSWEDLQLMYSAFTEGTMTLRGSAELQGRAVHQLLLIPSPKTESAYSRIYLDVDKESCVPLEVRLMESGDRLRKRYTADATTLTQIKGGFWYAGVNKLEDLQEKTHTKMLVNRQAEADARLRSQLFDPKRFYQAR